jgi:hypothetical protein
MGCGTDSPTRPNDMRLPSSDRRPRPRSALLASSYQLSGDFVSELANSSTSPDGLRLAGRCATSAGRGRADAQPRRDEGGQMRNLGGTQAGRCATSAGRSGADKQSRRKGGVGWRQAARGCGTVAGAEPAGGVSRGRRRLGVRRGRRCPRGGTRRRRPSPGTSCRRVAARPRRCHATAPGSRPCRRCRPSRW